MLLLFTLLAQAPAQPVVVLDPSVTATDTAALKAVVIKAEAAQDAEFDEAQKLVRQAQDAAQKGRQAALDLRTDEAIRHFEEAQTLYGRGIAAIDDYTGMAQSLIELGAAFLDARKDEKASNAFRRALAIGAGVKPDPNKYPPAVVNRFNNIERDITRAARGSMTVQSRPEGAEVYLDGRRMGNAPISLNDILIGEHWLVVRSSDYYRFSSRVTLGKEKLERTDVFLRELPAPSTPAAKAAWAVRRKKDDQLVAAQRELNASVLVVVTQKGAVLEAHRFGVAAVVATSCAELNEKLFGANAVATPVAADRAPDRTDQPLAVKESPRRNGVHWAVAMLPAGVGQFAEKRYGWGSLFLVSEVVFLTANIVAFYMVQADRNASDRTTFNNPGRSEALKWVSNIGLGLLVADVIAGGIDGVLHRNPD